MKRIHIEIVDRELAAVLAAKTPSERFGMIADSYRTARMLVESSVRLLHPDWTDAQIRSETARRMMNRTKCLSGNNSASYAGFEVDG